MTDEHGRGPDFDMDPAGPGAVEPALPERIRQVVWGEPYAILATQGDGQPYGSIVAFAMADDFRTAVFATPIATRKYRLLATVTEEFSVREEFAVCTRIETTWPGAT